MLLSGKLANKPLTAEIANGLGSMALTLAPRLAANSAFSPESGPISK
jgi:hypothetical protein